MSLARAWRRQLYGASSAALIVPSAMLAAVIVLALGGGFGQVGVLGQIFAGPPAPSPSHGVAQGAGPAAAARGLPAIPAAAHLARPTRRPIRVVGPGRGRGPVVPVSSRGAGGALAPVGAVAPVVSGPVRTPAPSHPAPVGSGSAPSLPVPPGGSSPQPGPPPQPGPSPQPTVVDQVVKVVAPVTEQLPAPAGPAVTQAVQAAGSAADGLLPPGLGSGAPGPGTALP
jgi:hypothetical protein